MESTKTSAIIKALEELVEKNGDLEFAVFYNGMRLDDDGVDVDLNLGHAETFLGDKLNYIEVETK